MQNTPSRERGDMLHRHPGISGDYNQGMKKECIYCSAEQDSEIITCCYLSVFRTSRSEVLLINNKIRTITSGKS